VRSATGPSKPKRFLLGKEKSRAKSAAAALEALWEEIENFYGQSLGPEDEPVWTHDTMRYAEAIRGNEPIVVEDDDDNSELNLAERLGWMRQTFPSIAHRFYAESPLETCQGSSSRSGSSWLGMNRSR